MTLELDIRKMNNAFGIESIKSENSQIFKNSLIYASNGVFKTSFAKTFDCISKGDWNNIKDKLSDKMFEFDIKINSEPLVKGQKYDNIIVFSKDIINKLKLSELPNIDYLTVDFDLAKKVSKINKNIELLYNTLINRINHNLGLKSEQDLKILTTTPSNKKLSFLIDIFANLLTEPQFSMNKNLLNKINIKKLKYNVYGKLDKQKDLLSYYAKYVVKEVSNDFFDEFLTPINIKELIKIIKETHFISQKRETYIQVKGITYKSFEHFEEFVFKKIKEITQDNKSIKFKQNIIENALDNTNESNFIRSNLNDIEYVELLSHGRKAIYYNFLRQNYSNEDIIKMHANLNKYALEIKKIVNKAKSSQTRFKKAVEIFNKRFKPEFIIDIQNEKEALTGLEAPQFVFKHNRNTSINQTEEDLVEILSSGQRTAFYTIKFIALYERKVSDKRIVILDDIVDSFDQGNKVAFIEYIHDMIQENTNIIILTHNFTFYRFVMSRLKKIKPKVAQVKKDKYNNHQVIIKKPDGLMKDSFNMAVINNKYQFFSSIPYIRELLSYTFKNKKKKKLLPLLHYCEETEKISIKKIKRLLGKHLKINTKFKREFAKTKYLHALKASYIENEFSDYDPCLYKKTLLSILIRISFEKLIIQDNYKLLKNINRNQTRTLIEKFESKLSTKIVSLGHNVLISTPDFIHANAFMFEPLVDTSIKRLKSIYREIDSINIEDVWI